VFDDLFLHPRYSRGLRRDCEDMVRQHPPSPCVWEFHLAPQTLWPRGFGTLGNLADALYRLEAANAKGSAIFCSPRTWNVLRQLQDLQDRYQLAPDPTEAATRQLFAYPSIRARRSATPKRPDRRGRCARTSCLSI